MKGFVYMVDTLTVEETNISGLNLSTRLRKNETSGFVWGNTGPTNKL